MTEDEVLELRRKLKKWGDWPTALLVPGVMLSLMPLPLVTLYQTHLHPVFLLSPLLLLGLVLFAQKRFMDWERASRRAIAAYYSEQYMGTKWVTPAGAEGVTIGVSTFGGVLKLTFPSGHSEEYEIEILARVKN